MRGCLLLGFVLVVGGCASDRLRTPSDAAPSGDASTGRPDAMPPPAMCVSDVPCVSNADCAGLPGTRCNTAIEPRRCQTVLCGTPRSLCSEDALCENERCVNGQCFDPSTPGVTYFFVVAQLEVAQADAANPEIVSGFNLDGAVTAGGDTTTGCGKMDFISPPPDNEPGVDNQLGPILSNLPGDLDVNASIAESVRNGELVLLVELVDVNDLLNDESVTVNIYVGTLPVGVTTPMLNGTQLAAGQTFDLDATAGSQASGAPLGSAPGAIVDGRLRAGSTDIPLSLGETALPITLSVRGAQIAATLEATGTTGTQGIIGGRVLNTETVAALAEIPDLEGNEALIEGVLRSQADLDPDPSMGGACTSVSLALELELVSAVKGVPRTP